MNKVFVFLLVVVPNLFYAQNQYEVFFDFDKSDLKENAVILLDEFVLNNTEINILRIEGFCDASGSSAYNIQLADRRIQSVEAFLKNKNVVFTENYQTKAFGKDFDLSSESEKNRKVILYYVKKITPEKLLEQEISLSTEKSLKEDVTFSEVGDKLKLEELNFYGGASIVLPKSERVLEELYLIMKENPSLKIEIQGHICCSGYDGDSLSTNRAKAVHTYLIKQGIEKERLTYKGFGSSQPIHQLPEKNEKEREDNRRVEIMIVSK